MGGDDRGAKPDDQPSLGEASSCVEADAGRLAITIAVLTFPTPNCPRRTIDAIVRGTARARADFPQHLCLDKGYDNDTRLGSRPSITATSHIAMDRATTAGPTRHKARRWVVNDDSPALSKCRAASSAGRRLPTTILGFLQTEPAPLSFVPRLHRLARLAESLRCTHSPDRFRTMSVWRWFLNSSTPSR